MKLPALRPFLLLPGLAAAPAAQTPADVVDLPVGWDAGARFEIELVKEREQYVNGRKTTSGGTRTMITFEVAEADDEGYVFHWTYGESVLLRKRLPGEPGEEEKSLEAELLELQDGLRLELRADLYGTPTGIENGDEIVAFYEAGLEKYRDQLLRLGADEAKLYASKYVGKAEPSRQLREAHVLRELAGAR